MSDWQYQPAKDHGLAPLERAKSLRRESGLVATVGHAAWWSCVRGFLKVYHRLEVHGAEHLPKEPPFVIVANHASHLDVLALAAPLPTRLRDRVFPIAAADVFFETPVVTMFAALMLNALPMYRANRGRHALVELRERLVGEPCGFVLFPEGARSRDGEMLPVKSGIGMIVGGTDVPIVPCWLEGCFNAMKPGQVIPRPRKISVHVGEPVRFPQAGNDREGWDLIARTLEERIKAVRPAKRA
jgi:1-acyl-sn-glycerol-3-phosphate acyltransferase